MFVNILLLAVSLLILTAGAELLVRGAASLALRFGVSTLFIGLTIVGFGTSTPELATSVNAGLNQMPDISLGNIIGSNIFNLALILGVTALIAPIPVSTTTVRRQLYIMIGAALLPFLAIVGGGMLTRAHGGVFLVGLLAFLVYGYMSDKPDSAEEKTTESELEKELGLAGKSIWSNPIVCVVAVLAALGLLVWGSSILIDSAVAIAEGFGISQLVIGLTVVAAGTSAPELFTSIVAAFRKQSDIAIGNIVGSNIFNILGIGGITAALYPQTVSSQILWMDAPLMVALSIAALPIMLTGKRISRIEGALFLVVYVGYTLTLLYLAPKWF